MAFLRKLLLNLGPAAIAALGIGGYIRYVLVFLGAFPAIVRGRTLKPLDRRMGRRPTRLRFMGRRVVIDCPRVDAIVTDGTFTFGIVRELGIRNCYLRHGVADHISGNAVVDLGANRGVFSAIAGAMGAERVLAVETLPPLREAVEANMTANGYDRCTVESVFVGAGGSYEARKGDTARLSEVLDRNGIDRVGVLKMDIEGSEYALFEEEGWLGRVDAICMEVHPEHGRVQVILDHLAAAGFDHRVGDHMFRDVGDVQMAEFIWAVRRSDGA